MENQYLLEKLDSIEEKLTNLQIDVALLKHNARLWGGIAGAIAGVVLSVISSFAHSLFEKH